MHELVPEIDVQLYTIGLLTFFAVLNLLGITESATVALCIFAFHVATLIILCSASIWFTIATGGGHLLQNWRGYPEPSVLIPLIGDDQPFHQRGFIGSLLFGFGTAMLGVSGFESSSQFIEVYSRKVIISCFIFSGLTVP